MTEAVSAPLSVADGLAPALARRATSRRDAADDAIRGIDRMALRASVRAMLDAIGEDPDREGLAHTPERVADMYAELFSGLYVDPVAVLDVVFEEHHDEMVLVRDIAFYSLCEHHLVPFMGTAHVAYIPNEAGQVTGLSKIARLVDCFSRRLQIQERLTTQVADTLERALRPRGVLVVLEAEHLCMTMRGVRKPGAKTVTSAVRGMFASQEATRAEAMSLIFRR